MRNGKQKSEEKINEDKHLKLCLFINRRILQWHNNIYNINNYNISDNNKDSNNNNNSTTKHLPIINIKIYPRSKLR